MSVVCFRTVHCGKYVNTIHSVGSPFGYCGGSTVSELLGYVLEEEMKMPAIIYYI